LLPGERGHSQTIKTAHDAIISFFDHNKDGVIGFDEFVLIVIALSVPEKDVEVVFDVIDLDNNGVLDANEFMQVRTYMCGFQGIASTTCAAARWLTSGAGECGLPACGLCAALARCTHAAGWFERVQWGWCEHKC
jgi:Ca2+-binding EF-hand superfamily protein